MLRQNYRSLKFQSPLNPGTLHLVAARSTPQERNLGRKNSFPYCVCKTMTEMGEKKEREEAAPFLAGVIMSPQNTSPFSASVFEYEQNNQWDVVPIALTPLYR